MKNHKLVRPVTVTKCHFDCQQPLSESAGRVAPRQDVAGRMSLKINFPPLKDYSKSDKDPTK